MTTPAESINDTGRRPAYRPPLGMPFARDFEGVRGTITSVLVHLLLLFLLVYASREPEKLLRLEDVPLGAGGINLPGGGGGGTRGSGGIPTHIEKLTFMQVAPAPAAVPTPNVTEEIKKPPPPTPKVETPPVVKPPEIQVPPPVVETKVSPVPTLGSIDDTMRGRGGGSGNDGTSGNGPGTGGGIGGGVGPGRGNGEGPGNGGGPGTIYPPVASALVLLPDPPSKLRPLELIALFDVDTTGSVLKVQFRPTGDRGYDKKVEAMLKEVKFRPAMDWWGRPVRATGAITFKR